MCDAVFRNILWAAFLALPTHSAQSPPLNSEPVVLERGPHEQRIQYTTRTTDANGTETETNSYVQLQTGLNRWSAQAQQYVAASPLIEVVNGHGIVQNTQHRAVFSQNLLDPNGTIDLLTPGGDRLVTQPVGIALTEADTGKSVFLAEVKPTQGILFDAQTFIYPNAFDQFKASIAIRSHLAGIESDVILEEKIDRALVEQFGINPATARIEIWHQVLQKPESRIAISKLARRDGSLDEDHTIHFRQMSIVPGNAYSLGAPELGLSQDGQLPVAKQWITAEGIDFLIEAIPFGQAEAHLNALPAPAQAHLIEKRAIEEAFAAKIHGRGDGSAGKSRSKPVSLAASRREWPKGSSSTQVALISASLHSREPGFVIDFLVSLASQTNLTFKGDTTYSVTGDVSLFGLTTIEGGTVVKFTNYTSLSPVIRIWDNLECKTSPYNPAIFTAKDDDTVGQKILGSTGMPVTTNYYSYFNLWLRSSSTSIFSIHDLQSRYSHVGIGSTRPAQDKIWNVQVYNCYQGLITSGGGFNIKNVLLHKTEIALNTVDAVGKIFDAEHMTINETGRLFMTATNSNCSLRITNSLIANVGINNATGISSNIVYLVPSSAFQSVGRGNHYLADSTYRNIGTTNISPEARAILKETTTYAPIHLTDDIVADTVLSPVVERDTTLPDLGYHYTPADYLIGDRHVTNATLVLTNGVSLALYGTNGLVLRDGSRLHSTGRPEALNTLVRYQSIQEDPSTSLGTANAVSLVRVVAPNTDPEVKFRFTRGNLLSASSERRYFVRGYSEAELLSNFSLRDCQFVNTHHKHSATVMGANMSIVIANNLFYRSWLSFYQDDYPPGYRSYPFLMDFRNNYVFGATFTFSGYSENITWTVKENFFDTPSSYGSAGILASHNAYRSMMSMGGSNNTNLTTIDFVTGPLGAYYYPSSGGNLSYLTDRGSRSAADAGLYHFTTSATGSKEGNTLVDIGFHYASTDSNGVPTDSDSDGVPDYLEDPDGDGALDSGETHFLSPTDVGLNVLITKPKANSNIP
jgi:hypothetical protein